MVASSFRRRLGEFRRLEFHYVKWRRDLRVFWAVGIILLDRPRFSEI